MVQSHSPNRPRQKTPLVFHPQPRLAAIQLQKRLLHRILSILPIPQQSKSHLKHELCLPLHHLAELLTPFRLLVQTSLFSLIFYACRQGLNPNTHLASSDCRADPLSTKTVAGRNRSFLFARPVPINRLFCSSPSIHTLWSRCMHLGTRLVATTLSLTLISTALAAQTAPQTAPTTEEPVRTQHAM